MKNKTFHKDNIEAIDNGIKRGIIETLATQKTILELDIDPNESEQEFKDRFNKRRKEIEEELILKTGEKK